MRATGARALARIAARASTSLARRVPCGLVEDVGEAYDISSPDGRLDVFRSSGRARCRPASGCTEAPSSAPPRGTSRTACGCSVGARVRDGRCRPLDGARLALPDAGGVRWRPAIAYIVDHADRLGVDPTRIVLAGDSEGALRRPPQGAAGHEFQCHLDTAARREVLERSVTFIQRVTF